MQFVLGSKHIIVLGRSVLLPGEGWRDGPRAMVYGVRGGIRSGRLRSV